MPNGSNPKTFKTINELMNEVVKKVNWIHYGSAMAESVDGTHYFLNFTDNYAQLKCSATCNSKKCLFMYWFKFKSLRNSNCKGGIERYDFKLFRLINSNHSMPLH